MTDRIGIFLIIGGIAIAILGLLTNDIIKVYISLILIIGIPIVMILQSQHEEIHSSQEVQQEKN